MIQVHTELMDWQVNQYPNHELISRNGVFGISCMDTMTGKPYGVYIIVPGAPYLPVSMIYDALGEAMPPLHHLDDCLAVCNRIYQWMKSSNHTHHTSARALREAAATYHHRVTMGLR